MTPRDLATKLKYGGAAHRVLHKAVQARLRMSERAMRERYEQMSKNEERFQAFVPESVNDAVRRRQRDSSGVPSYRTIEIPYSYAILMTAHSYYTSVFLSRNPAFQVAGRHGEAENKTQAVEAVLDYQVQVGENLVPLFLWLLDPGKYGFGVIGHYWDEQYTVTRTYTEEQPTFLGLPIPGKKPIQIPHVEKTFGYRGNKLYNVRPQDFFPDPRVPMRRFQQGEFCARYVENSWFDIVHGGAQGKYFNVAELKKLRAEKMGVQGSGAMVSRDEGSSNVSKLPDSTAPAGAAEGAGDIPAGFVKSYEFYTKVIPAEWGFGPETDCEIWAITVSANGVIYGCEPLGEWHGKFPFDLLEHEPEAYNMFSRSMLEVSQPLADIVTWLVNSHFYNVRQTLNNQFIVDPSMVVMKDMENPNPGKLIRLKPEAYGRDVRTILTQLQTMDVTKGHIGDISMVSDFIQRVTGVTDPAMGMLPGKSHTTATAVRTSTSFGVNRMKTNCEYYSAMGFAPLTQKLIQRTQQRMDFELMMKVAGDLSQFGKPFVQVDPNVISGFYDFVPVDGTMPVDRFAQANLWQMIFGQLQKFPQIMQTYDMAKIFAWVATLAGIKNMSQFRLVPDEQMQQQVQAGNVVPISAALQDAAPRTNLNEPRQVPGAGPTG